MKKKQIETGVPLDKLSLAQYKCYLLLHLKYITCNIYCKTRYLWI